MTRNTRLGWKAAVGSALAAAALIATPVAATAATTDGPTGSDCTFGQHLVELWTTLPADLRDDLAGLSDLAPGERIDRAREIRDAAVAGQYGEGVQRYAQRAHDRHLLRWVTMPSDLRAALVDVVTAAPEDRAAMLRQVADDAAAGTYGDRATHVVERVRSSEAWQACVAE